MPLPSDKQRLIEQRIIEGSVDAATRGSIPRRDSSGVSAALSFAQQRLWFLDRLEPGSPAYNIPRLYRVRGKLNPEALGRCVDEIVRRHDSLRTVVVEERGEPAQRILPRLEGILRVEDVRATGPDDRESRGMRLAQEEVLRPFDLTKGPLIRVLLVRISEEDFLLLITMHHFISDGWSVGVFVRELDALYKSGPENGGRVLADLPIQYADFAVWQRASLQGAFLEGQMRYWRTVLAGELPILELGTDHARPASRRSQGATHRFVIPSPTIEGVKNLSRQEGCTLFMTLLSAYAVLLQRYSGQDEMIIGTPIAGRTRLETEGLVGLFVNTLAMRLECSGDPPFRELMKRVREKALGAYEHQDVPFEKLVEELQPERTLSRTPVFQTMFILQNTPAPVLRMPGIEAERTDIDTGTAKFDVTMSIIDKGDRTEGLLEYDRELFEPATISGMATHYLRLLTAVCADAGARISALRMLTPEEEHQLTVGWNATQAPYPADQCLHQLIEAQAASSPYGTALVSGKEILSYDELNQRANRLAHMLRRSGVGPEVLVGICMERSPSMIIALLAVLKSGGAYVALDPSYPAERISFMIDDARAAIVLTDESVRARLPVLAGVSGARVVAVDRHRDLLEKYPEENPASDVRSDNLAYVIYTSGSTGRPKGVAIEHRNAAVLIGWAGRTYSREELGGVLGSTSICFDLSVFEIFVPLALGGTVILAENVLQLPALPGTLPVTLMNTVPSAAAELVRIGGIPSTVRVVNLAGEPLTTSLVRQLYGLGFVRKVYDLYGPSEDTTYSTFALRTADGPQTIGRPLANKQVYIVDSHDQLVPVGVKGEILIGGKGVARGYLHRPELTGQRFSHNPFSPDQASRVYRTGDLGRYLPDGSIEFLGRIDHQVKFRGFRIELGEIETVIASHGSVQEAVVIVREDVPGNPRIVAYVVPREGRAVTGIEVRTLVKTSVPEYMVPSAVVMLRSLPLLPNGKVNRRALPPPETDQDVHASGGIEAPRSHVEKIIAQIWTSILGVKEVGIHDNFFDLGGHSLLATQVISRMRETLRVDIPLISLFESPTVEGLASVAEEIVLREIEQRDEHSANGPLP